MFGGGVEDGTPQNFKNVAVGIVEAFPCLCSDTMFGSIAVFTCPSNSSLCMSYIIWLQIRAARSRYW